ncbi:MAG: hypothetical protein KDB27_14425 [Planctomycetales bacterium]|nr:hypothetical protein [Planctomycetales bacterium]
MSAVHALRVFAREPNLISQELACDLECIAESHLSCNDSELACCSHIAAAEQALQRHFPDFGKQLTYRMRPLRDQWEVRGPGLLKAVATQVFGAASVDTTQLSSIQIELVHPLVGGDAYVCNETSIVMEAVLANPFPKIPEVGRLAWCIAQIMVRRAIETEGVCSDVSVELLALAPCLAAAQHVELLEFSSATVGQAAAVWRVDHKSESFAEQLHKWWQSVSRDNVRWTEKLSKWPLT